MAAETVNCCLNFLPPCSLAWMVSSSCCCWHHFWRSVCRVAVARLALVAGCQISCWWPPKQRGKQSLRQLVWRSVAASVCGAASASIARRLADVQNYPIAMARFVCCDMGAALLTGRVFFFFLFSFSARLGDRRIYQCCGA